MQTNATTQVGTPLSRRSFLRKVGIASGSITGVLLLNKPLQWVAAASLQKLPISHSVNTAIYAPHLIAQEKGYLAEEGLEAEFIVPGGGARVVQVLTAGQALFAQGDSSHVLKATEKGKPTLMIYATDIRCSYANIVVRKELWDAGLTSVEKLATMKRKNGSNLIIAATAIGSGTWVYGNYVLSQYSTGDGKTVNDHVQWVGGGSSATMLGGLKSGQFDAIMAVPVWIWAAEGEGFGKLLYDARDETTWNRVFGGNIPATVGYVLQETIEKEPEKTQGYVNAIYRAMKWLKSAENESIYEMIGPKYMSTFKKEDILREIEYYKGIWDYDAQVAPEDYQNGLKVWIPRVTEKPFAYEQVVNMSFVQKAAKKFS